MSSTSFKVAFEGDPFEGGEIAVTEVAPALMALGDLIQSANRALNGQRAEARLMLKATNKGSFEALLSIDFSMVQSIKDMLDAVVESSDRVVAANALLELVLKGGAIGAGLIAAVKFLGGKRPDSVQKLESGQTSITLNNTTIIVDGRTVKLLEDLPTREALANFCDRALSIQGLTKIRLGEKNGENVVALSPNDKPSFRVPDLQNDPSISETIEREVLLKIVTSHFRDGYKWRFTDGGERPFTAEMEDAEFLNEVLQGKITLSANDTLRCKVREEQKLSTSGLTKEIKVVKVVEHIPGARQLKLI